MTPGPHLLVIFISAIAVLLIAIIRFRVNPFLALLGTGLLTGLICGMSPAAVAKQLSTGFGNTLGGIGIVIGLGIIFGNILSDARATQQIAALLLRLAGAKKSLLAVNLTGYFASIPVFFDAAFVIFVPLLRNLSRRTGLPLVGFVTALAIGLISTHCLVIPTPGPLAVMANMNLQAGPFIAAGLFVALIASLSGGLVMGRWIAGQFRHDWEDQEVEEPTSSEEPAPSGGVSIAVLLFPILLILVGSVSAPFLAADSWARQVLSFAGDKNVALFAGVILASVAMRPYLRKPIDTLVVEGAASAGLILLITGAGGFFGSVISASGIGDYLVQTLSSLHVSLIFLGFILAAILRGAQGSATVALVTASSILAPMTVAAAANPLTVALGICCGSMCCSFPNDSGFWVVARFGGMSVSQTLRAWTLASSMGGLAGLGATLLIDQIF